MILASGSEVSSRLLAPMTAQCCLADVVSGRIFMGNRQWMVKRSKIFVMHVNASHTQEPELIFPHPRPFIRSAIRREHCDGARGGSVALDCTFRGRVVGAYP